MHNPFEAPENSHVAPITQPMYDDISPELASLGARFAGAVIDGISIVIIFIPIILVAGITESFESKTVLIKFAYGVLGLAIFITINGYLLARRGQTMGKILAKTQIVNAHTYQVPGIGSTIGMRYLLNGVLGQIPLYSFIDALFIFGKEKRCIHDYLARTVVIAYRPNK
tara:strand:- start:241 stop:747 length:507 start_codon:yes stop_codon:yes gene_type:complete